MNSGLTRPAGLLALLTLAALSTAASAQVDFGGQFPPAYPAYPTGSSFGEIKLWIAGDTNLPQDQIVLTSAQAVFAFIDPKPPAAGGTVVRRQVREEVISPDVTASLGGRSATAEIDFDCAHAETTVDQVRVYPGANLAGGPGQAVSAAHWLAANTGLDLTDLAQVACARRGPSPEPPRAPTKTSVASATPKAAASAPPTAVAGRAWVQIGAYPTPELAQDNWRALQSRWPEQTAALSMHTAPVPHGDKTLFRTLVGPFERPQAKAFCDALRAQGGDCLIR